MHQHDIHQRPALDTGIGMAISTLAEILRRIELRSMRRMKTRRTGLPGPAVPCRRSALTSTPDGMRNYSSARSEDPAGRLDLGAKSQSRGLMGSGDESQKSASG
jgi:hypothetical protein